jgi:hypothetical protein
MKQLIRHILKEENRLSKITKMIDNIGLSQTIKSLGGYNNFINLIPDYFNNKSNKIKLIREMVLQEEEKIIYFYEITTDEEDLEIYIEEKPNGSLIQWVVVDVDVKVACIKGVYIDDGYDVTEDIPVKLEELDSLFINGMLKAIVNFYL